MTFIRLALGLWTWAIVGVVCLGGLATLVAPGGIVRPSPVHPVYPPNLAISGKVIGSRGGVPRDLRVLVWGEDAFGRYGGESVPLTGDDEFVASRLEPGTYVLQAQRCLQATTWPSRSPPARFGPRQRCWAALTRWLPSRTGSSSGMVS